MISQPDTRSPRDSSGAVCIYGITEGDLVQSRFGAHWYGRVTALREAPTPEGRATRWSATVELVCASDGRPYSEPRTRTLHPRWLTPAESAPAHPEALLS